MYIGLVNSKSLAYIGTGQQDIVHWTSESQGLTSTKGQANWKSLAEDKSAI